ncbi:MAG: hypothetical protein HYX72_06590 [Acidobacteria bacterium]|nr:hypothetical protein [Acidobacteriota bacterium]
MLRENCCRETIRGKDALFPRTRDPISIAPYTPSGGEEVACLRPTQPSTDVVPEKPKLPRL